MLQLHAQDNLHPNMVGWLFQPNTSYQVYFEVVAVSGASITVAGDVTPLYDNNLAGVAQKDYRWMLMRPPGISALISDEGALYHQPHYQTTSCLFAGYRYSALKYNWQQCDR